MTTVIAISGTCGVRFLGFCKFLRKCTLYNYEQNKLAIITQSIITIAVHAQACKLAIAS